jgi:hypothetical protein
LWCCLAAPVLVLPILSLAARAGAGTPEPPAPAALRDAVRATVQAGSARLDATVTSRAMSVHLRGVTSLVTDDADVEVDGGIEVRAAGGRSWVRPGLRAAWSEVGEPDPAAAVSWRDLLDDVAGATDARWTGRRAITAGGATVAIDDAGRIEHVRLPRPGGVVFDVAFHDFGAPVELAPP